MSDGRETPGTGGRAFIPVRIAVMTVSDTRVLEDDRSGQLLSELIAAAGHQLSARAIVKDEVAQIRRTARNWLKRDDIQHEQDGTVLGSVQVPSRALAVRAVRTQ